MRSYTALPYEYTEEMSELTDEEWGRLIRALLRYSATGEEPELSGNERFYWRRVANREQRYQTSFREQDERRSEAARRAAQARWGTPDADGCERMPGDAPDAKTKTEAKTEAEAKTKTKTYTPRPYGRRSRAEEAAAEECLRRDVAELARLMESGDLL